MKSSRAMSIVSDTVVLGGISEKTLELLPATTKVEIINLNFAGAAVSGDAMAYQYRNANFKVVESGGTAGALTAKTSAPDLIRKTAVLNINAGGVVVKASGGDVIVTVAETVPAAAVGSSIYIKQTSGTTPDVAMKLLPSILYIGSIDSTGKVLTCHGGTNSTASDITSTEKAIVEMSGKVYPEAPGNISYTTRAGDIVTLHGAFPLTIEGSTVAIAYGSGLLNVPISEGETLNFVVEAYSSTDGTITVSDPDNAIKTVAAVSGTYYYAEVRHIEGFSEWNQTFYEGYGDFSLKNRINTRIFGDTGTIQVLQYIAS